MMSEILFGGRMNRADYLRGLFLSILAFLFAGAVLWASFDEGSVVLFCLGSLLMVVSSVASTAIVVQRLRDVAPSRNIWTTFVVYVILSMLFGFIPALFLLFIPSGALDERK